MLDMVPQFKRQIRNFVQDQDTDSTLAAYLSDGVEALSYRWPSRLYAITVIEPNSYIVTPDIVAPDKRAVILMGAIIYMSGQNAEASFHDGDFAWSVSGGKDNSLALAQTELNLIVPAVTKLAHAITSPIRGYSNIYNPESYMFFLGANWGF
jgi:hypothetical protein